MRSLRSCHLPPLPGTERRPRGLFVGRWGALLERPVDGLCRRLDEARFSERAGEVLFRATQSGWRLYLVGNETAVARGRLSEACWESFQRELHARLAALGIALARDYACLDHPEGKGKHQRDSVFRFPNTGAFYHALQEDGIELASSWLVSDDVFEIAAASRAGLRTVSIGRAHRLNDDALEVEADERAASLCEAVEALLAGDPLRRA